MTDTRDRGFETILVATDFSPSAEVAVARAAVIASRLGSRVHLVHVLGDVSRTTPPTRAVDAMSRRLLEQERSLAVKGIATSSAIEGPGRPWRFIVQSARECDADLVVVGTRGQTPYSRILLGRTADHVVRFSSRPVLCVRGDDAGDIVKEQTVLVATDFSDESALARDAAVKTLEATGGGTLLLVHAIKPIHYYTGEIGTAASVGAVEREDEQAEAERAMARLERQAEELRAAGRAVESIVEIGYPATVIEELARERGVDLVALGTHGRSGISHLLLGSIAERVLHHAPCSVLTMRDPTVPPSETVGRNRREVAGT